jgi:hypothetical protein
MEKEGEGSTKSLPRYASGSSRFLHPLQKGTLWQCGVVVQEVIECAGDYHLNFRERDVREIRDVWLMC